MRVTLAFDCDNAAFDQDLSGEVMHVLAQARQKLMLQLLRKPGCICTHPESADKLLDSNGNTVGSLTISED